MNKICTHVMESISNHTQERETGIPAPSQTCNVNDTQMLVAAIGGGRGLKANQMGPGGGGGMGPQDGGPRVVGPGGPPGGNVGPRPMGMMGGPGQGEPLRLLPVVSVF